MRSCILLLPLAALAFCSLPLTSSSTIIVNDPANQTVNTSNYLTQLQSWTSSLANEAKGLSQGMTQINQGAQQIQQFAQQIQQYYQMLSYIGNPRALANAVGLGPLVNLATQFQNLYSQFSNVHDLQSLTSATGAMSNTLNGLYPAVNPNNVINSQAFQKYQLLTKAGDQFQNLLNTNRQYQQQLAGQMSQAVRDLQNAQTQSQIMRAQGAIAAIQAAQRASQDAVQDAINAEIDVALEEQAMNEQADEAAYQEALKEYAQNEHALTQATIDSLGQFGSNRPQINGTATAVPGTGYQLQRLSVRP
jgi:hypothetical protein